MSNQLTIDLPWPPKDLSPNARVHWAKKSRAAKRYRHTCRFLAQQAIAKTGIIPDRLADRVGFDMTFYPPDKRRRDDDNLISSCKNLMDGISDALLLDDCKFRLSIQVMRDTPVKGGLVRVRIG